MEWGKGANGVGAKHARRQRDNKIKTAGWHRQVHDRANSIGYQRGTCNIMPCTCECLYTCAFLYAFARVCSFVLSCVTVRVCVLISVCVYVYIVSVHVYGCMYVCACVFIYHFPCNCTRVRSYVRLCVCVRVFFRVCPATWLSSFTDHKGLPSSPLSSPSTSLLSLISSWYQSLQRSYALSLGRLPGRSRGMVFKSVKRKNIYELWR